MRPAGPLRISRPSRPRASDSNATATGARDARRSRTHDRLCIRGNTAWVVRRRLVSGSYQRWYPLDGAPKPGRIRSGAGDCGDWHAGIDVIPDEPALQARGPSRNTAGGATLGAWAPAPPGSASMINGAIRQDDYRIVRLHAGKTSSSPFPLPRIVPRRAKTPIGGLVSLGRRVAARRAWGLSEESRLPCGPMGSQGGPCAAGRPPAEAPGEMMDKRPKPLPMPDAEREQWGTGRERSGLAVPHCCSVVLARRERAGARGWSAAKRARRVPRAQGGRPALAKGLPAGL